MVRSIKMLVLDIDGVITDGTIAVTGSAGEQKRISFVDLDAVTHTRGQGIELALLTAEDSPAVDDVATRFAIANVRRGAKDKLRALHDLVREAGIPMEQACYVGDSDRDAPALQQAGLGIAPANATPAAKAAADCVLAEVGGRGAVAAVVRIVCTLRHDVSAADGLREEVESILGASVQAHEALVKESLPDLVALAQMMVTTIVSGRKIMLFGNGGSAADAQHVAGELVGRFLQESEPWPAIALTTDTSILTAVGNDWSFDDVFARQVRALARPGDLAVGISTSGRSPNVLRGLEVARDLRAGTVAMTGRGNHQMDRYVDLCVAVPAEITPRIQELHLASWHAVCEIVERMLLSDGAS